MIDKSVNHTSTNDVHYDKLNTQLSSTLYVHCKLFELLSTLNETIKYSPNKHSN